MSSDRAHPTELPDSLSARAASALFRVYKATVSPTLHALGFSRCIYLPTCSEYAYTAVARFGPLRGSWLALRRVLRCHPWAAGGFDPLPETASTEQRAAANRLP